MKEVLLVTGSSGIAAATARLWAAENPVFLVGINTEECKTVAATLAEAGAAPRMSVTRLPCGMPLLRAWIDSGELTRFSMLPASARALPVTARFTNVNLQPGTLSWT